MNSKNVFMASVFAAIVFTMANLRPNLENSAHAMTAHGTDKKTIATVPLDVGMEAVVTLDHVTRDLTAYVLNRISGKFFIQYRYNIANDFPNSQGKYLMAAGNANFQQFTGNERLADGVIYIAEEASGQVVAYGLPWNSQLRTSAAGPQIRSFVALDYAATRFKDVAPKPKR
jgi:hypothetical protein